MYCLRRLGYIKWLEIEVLFFRDVGLPDNSTDEDVWRFCQKNGYYLLTGNRSAKAKEASLHAVLNRLADEKSLPVMTIGNPNRVINDGAYCAACAEAIAKIVSSAELYVGVPRLYIP
jgi:hypothetical protein